MSSQQADHDEWHRTHPHIPGNRHGMSAADWDERYAAAESLWSTAPNCYVAEHCADLPPGRAVDLACGEGRCAIYLAQRGWQVTGVDFSEVAIGRARARAPHIDWLQADVTDYQPQPVDLALVIYAHLPSDERRAMLRRISRALTPGGRVLIVGHNTRNIAEGIGGPQDPEITYTAADLVADFAAAAPGLMIEVADEPLREVAGAGRPAIDTVVLARRPT